MKKWLLSTIAALTLVSSLLVQSVFSLELLFDGATLETDVPPQIVNGRTLVPMRAIFEAFGATVDWDADTRTAIATSHDTTIVLTLGSQIALVNGAEVELDVPAQAIEGRTMVPVRFVSETLDADVDWIPETQTVVIVTATGSSAEVQTEGNYVGSIDSDKYHLPTCRHAESILPENEIWFSTIEQAQTAGYSPCGICSPR